ncbi:MAG: alcohol dehydrogenase catalytic domain-containing protein [Armatimonadota bacterium]|jgi:threonine dehydrogenase-like Zn-dependent dehydrogenase
MPAEGIRRAQCLRAVEESEYPDNFEVTDGPVPELADPTHALARPYVATICLTDIKIATGHFERAELPRVLGHEGGVEIVEVGERANELRAGHGLTPLAEGQKAAMDPNVVCLRSECPYCRSRHTNFCPTMYGIGVSSDGLFQEQLSIPALQLDILPDAVAHLAPFQELLACVLHGYKKISVDPGDKVIILGSGMSALCQLMLVRRHRPAMIVVTDLVQERLDRAAELGATHTVLLERGQPKDAQFDALWDMTEGADVVIEATGARQSIELALMGRERDDDWRMLIRKNGQILLFGISGEQLEGLNQEIWYLHGAAPQASFIYTRDDFLEAHYLLLDLADELPPFIGPRHPLTTDGVRDAFRTAKASSFVGRTAIAPQQTQ